MNEEAAAIYRGLFSFTRRHYRFLIVIPAKAGIQKNLCHCESRFIGMWQSVLF